MGGSVFLQGWVPQSSGFGTSRDGAISWVAAASEAETSEVGASS